MTDQATKPMTAVEQIRDEVARCILELADRVEALELQAQRNPDVVRAEWHAKQPKADAAAQEHPKTGSIPAALAKVYEAGGKAWDDIADPDAYIRDMRGEPAGSQEPDPRMQCPLDGPGSHRADLVELRLTKARLAQAEAVIAAAKRLLLNVYTPWDSAGGPNECPHGRSEGIPCRRCDERMVHEAALASQPTEKEKR